LHVNSENYLKVNRRFLTIECACTNTLYPVNAEAGKCATCPQVEAHPYIFLSFAVRLMEFSQNTIIYNTTPHYSCGISSY